MKIVTIVLLLCAFGCSNKEELPDNSIIEERKPIVRMPIEKNDKIVEIYLNKMSFSEAFNIQYRAKGEGKTFWWRGNEYIIRLKREEIL